MPPKINLYLLKATEFCNLNCPYCYMFNLRDTAYKLKPKIMSDDIVEAAARKITALAQQQEMKRITISLHGGEPMLAGLDWYRNVVETFRRTAGEKVEFTFATQTNGTLLDDKWLQFFESVGITVGISMDGPKHIHDKFRVNFAGKGSYDEVVSGLKATLRYPKVAGSVLCVIDPTADGLEVYRHFRDLGATSIDFLWPLEHNWDAPPPGYDAENYGALTPYADYLIPIFDEWWQHDKDSVSIRYFRQIAKNLLGGKGGLDSLGGNPISIVGIDTDGSLEPVDSLRACGDGFTHTGLNILSDPIEAIYDHPLFQTALAGQEGLCSECTACSLHDVCGGGYLPHRYSQQNGFDNPTVYCRDVWKLTLHILSAVRENVAPQESVDTSTPSVIEDPESKPTTEHLVA